MVVEVEPFSDRHLRLVGKSVAERVMPVNREFIGGVMSGSWHTVASELRLLSPESQRQFLLEYFGPQGANFPNGQHLAEYFFEVINTDWFGPHPLLGLDTEREDKLIYDHLAALNLNLPGEKLTSDDWHIARGRVCSAVRKAARDSDRYEAQWRVGRFVDGLMSMYLYQQLDKSGRDRYITKLQRLTMVESIGHDAKWITVEDLMGEQGYTHGNPFEPLRRLFQEGRIPLGFRKGRFAVKYLQPLRPTA